MLARSPQAFRIEWLCAHCSCIRPKLSGHERLQESSHDMSLDVCCGNPCDMQAHLLQRTGGSGGSIGGPDVLLIVAVFPR
jgi:hypothetical protein